MSWLTLRCAPDTLGALTFWSLSSRQILGWLALCELRSLRASPAAHGDPKPVIYIDSEDCWSLQDINSEIQDVMGQNFALPYDIDEDELMGELDGMEDELASEFETGNGASYLQVAP